jgi:transcriptional regulator with XRE-family HTH domain
MTQVNLAEKLRYLRKSRGMSQVELARRLGLKNNAFISHLEHGTKRPSEALLRKIAEVFSYDYASLSALGGGPGAVVTSAQVELHPAAGADLMARIRREAELLGERMSDLVGEALPEFLWSREERLLAESASRELWILCPQIMHHGVEPDLLAVASANLRRGVRYAYLIADTKDMRMETGRMLKRYQEGSGEDDATEADVEMGLGPEVAFVPHESFPFVFEAALFDPRDPARIRGSLVPPAENPEWEVALSRQQALDLARHFARLWDRVSASLSRIRAG